MAYRSGTVTAALLSVAVARLATPWLAEEAVDANPRLSPAAACVTASLALSTTAPMPKNSCVTPSYVVWSTVTPPARRLAAGPAYAVVADPRFADKLALILRSTAGARGFCALVAGRDDVAALPAGAPVYVSGLARERLTRAGAACPASDVREGRVLSEASARELLRFIVRANAAAGGAAEPMVDAVAHGGAAAPV